MPFGQRRTYAVTGDRIRLDFTLNGNMMGRVVPLPAGKPRQIAIDIDGWDSLDRVEIIKNGQAITARTRSASRSNPQRMSVASLANQMRAACAWSSVCKLGSPIMTRTRPPPTTLASDWHRTPALPSDSDRYSAAPQSKIPVRSGNALAPAVAW